MGPLLSGENEWTTGGMAEENQRTRLYSKTSVRNVPQFTTASNPVDFSCSGDRATAEPVRCRAVSQEPG